MEAIIGGVIGFLIFMGVVGVVICLIKKHNQSRVMVVPAQQMAVPNPVVLTQSAAPY